MNHIDELSCWDILGLTPTSQQALIKKAYAVLLKTNKPDQNPSGFIRLRAAFDEAMQISQWIDDDITTDDAIRHDELSEGPDPQHRTIEPTLLPFGPSVDATNTGESTVLFVEPLSLAKNPQNQPSDPLDSSETVDLSAFVAPPVQSFPLPAPQPASQQQPVIPVAVLQPIIPISDDIARLPPLDKLEQHWNDLNSVGGQELSDRIAIELKQLGQMPLDDRQSYEEALLGWLSMQEVPDYAAFQLAADYFNWHEQAEFHHVQWPWSNLESLFERIEDHVRQGSYWRNDQNIKQWEQLADQPDDLYACIAAQIADLFMRPPALPDATSPSKQATPLDLTAQQRIAYERDLLWWLMQQYPLPLAVFQLAEHAFHWRQKAYFSYDSYGNLLHENRPWSDLPVLIFRADSDFFMLDSDAALANLFPHVNRWYQLPRWSVYLPIFPIEFYDLNQEFDRLQQLEEHAPTVELLLGTPRIRQLRRALHLKSLWNYIFLTIGLMGLSSLLNFISPDAMFFAFAILIVFGLLYGLFEWYRRQQIKFYDDYLGKISTLPLSGLPTIIISCVALLAGATGYWLLQTITHSDVQVIDTFSINLIGSLLIYGMLLKFAGPYLFQTLQRLQIKQPAKHVAKVALVHINFLVLFITAITVLAIWQPFKPMPSPLWICLIVLLPFILLVYKNASRQMILRLFIAQAGLSVISFMVCLAGLFKTLNPDLWAIAGFYAVYLLSLAYFFVQDMFIFKRLYDDLSPAEHL